MRDVKHHNPCILGEMWENDYALSDTYGGNIQTVHILRNGNRTMKS